MHALSKWQTGKIRLQCAGCWPRSILTQPPSPKMAGATLLAITAGQYPGPNAQHHETPRIIQGVPPIECASSSEVIVAR